MNKLYSLSIKSQLFAIVLIMALFASGIIAYSGISFRNEKINEALKDSAILADSLSHEHEKMVASAQQLMLTLAQLTEIKKLDIVAMEPIIKDVLRVNPRYSNIFIADRKGRVVASAVPSRDTNVSDRRYFRNALSSGRFSSGEFIISRFTGKPVIAFCYPFKGSQGEISGVIVMGIDLSYYRPLLDNLALPLGSSYLLIDHKGTIMTRGISPTDFIGDQYSAAGFKRMADGPEKDTFVSVAHDGIKRFISYRKIRLEGEEKPYMYIRSGIPVSTALSAANKALMRNIVIFMASLCIVLVSIFLIAKNSIVGRIELLEMASKRLADGDLTGRVSELVSGGELGRLSLTFDHMARQIASREEVLLESNRRFEQLAKQSQTVHWEVNADGLYTFVTGVSEAVFGYSPEELIRNLHFYDLHPEKGREAFKAAAFEVFARKEHFHNLENPIQTKDGRIVWVSTDGIPLLDAHGNLSGYRGSDTNITERRRVENALREANELFSLFMRYSPVYVFIKEVTPTESRVLKASENYQQMIGIPASEMLGKTMADLFPSEFAEKITADDWAVVSGGAVLKREENFSGRSYTTIKFPIVQGDKTLLAGYTIDNTEKHLLEEERLKTQKLESIGTLAGGIAHDFNNLLQGIFGYISMAKITHDEKEKSLAMLNQAEEALHLSVNLTTQLLTFSKGGKPVKKLIRLEPAVENAVKFALSGSHTNYEMNIMTDLWAVEADEGQLAQVIQNIVINANEAMAGRGTVNVSVTNIDIPSTANPRLPDGGRFVRIDIQDTGTGISEQNLSKIFDPYFSTKQKGSGLGLATSYSIIKNHGGAIEVKSEPQRGTTFSIYLPASEGLEMSTASPAATAVGTKKSRVLLMDDEDLVRNVAREMIAALGHEVVSAEDGRKAIELFQQAKDDGVAFDLVILDLTVKGGMDGEEAIAKIRAIDPNVKAVVSSGYAHSPVVADYRAYGFSAILNKPYRIDALQNCFNQLLS